MTKLVLVLFTKILIYIHLYTIKIVMKVHAAALLIHCYHLDTASY
jgi:hypothetical protein